MEVALTTLGAFLGALFSILATMFIEYEKKPKLKFEIEHPPHDGWQSPEPNIAQSRFLRVKVYNKPMPTLLHWLDRSAALQCTGNVQFFRESGTAIFSSPMKIRWSGSDEPNSPQLNTSGVVVYLFDVPKYNAAFRRDCFPGVPELVDIAARYDNEDECYGWSNESYLKGVRNPDFKLDKGRYLVKITIYFSGNTASHVFALENYASRKDFRLEPTSKAEKKRMRS